MKTVRFSADARAALRDMPAALRRDFQAEIMAIAAGEAAGDRLEGPAADLRRIKYNGWRALIRVSADAVFVERLGPRADIYRGLGRRR